MKWTVEICQEITAVMFKLRYFSDFNSGSIFLISFTLLASGGHKI